MKLLSIVVSVYNEEQALPEFYEVAVQVMEEVVRDGRWDYELLFVNDGSQDRSLGVLRDLAGADSRVKVIEFSRNFGHEAAMIAGLDYSRGDAVLCMDADLQHPPACIPQIIDKLEQGYEVINMVRVSNESAGWVKNLTSTAFYRLINRIADVHFEDNASDFFCISRAAAQVLKSNYREKVRFLRGYVQNIGFEKATIEFAAARRVAGESKYSLKKLFDFSINTIVCFSDMPLKLGIYAGLFAGLIGILMMGYTVYTWARVGTPSGYATIIVLICFMFAMLFMIVGIIGQYIAILFGELKDRPIYIVRGTQNIEGEGVEGPQA